MAKPLKSMAAGAVLVVALSPLGVQTVKQYEGLGQPGRNVQQAYPDPYRGWRTPTICYGHTQGVRRGDTATLAQCEAWLAQDSTKHCDIVYRALVPQGIWLTQGEQDAYCSFAYNLGTFKNTASVYGRLTKLDDWGACMGLLKYHYSNGKPSQGLWNRRYAEYNLCISQLDYKYADDITEYLSGDYPSYSQVDTSPVHDLAGPQDTPVEPGPGSNRPGSWWSRLVARLGHPPGSPERGPGGVTAG